MKNEIEAIKTYWRMANYLSLIQIYLKQNVLLTEKLSLLDLKEPIIGHWGTVPGINFVYAHLNSLIKRTGLKIHLIIGPGHGAAAVHSNLYMEGILQEYYPQYNRTIEGLTRFASDFGHSSVLQTELSPFIPGVFHQGGELGYSLSVAYGIALDNPSLIVACLIGDGEAETGAIATAWQSNKFINSSSGIVLPIIHLNGAKLGSQSLFSLMTKRDLVKYFQSLGYKPVIVGADHHEMYEKLSKVAKYIFKLKNNKINKLEKFREYPIIILYTPKGWTGPKNICGEAFEGTAKAHKAPYTDIFKNPELLIELEQWLKSYHPAELFNNYGAPKSNALSILPDREMRLGYAKIRPFKECDLKLPDFRNFQIKQTEIQSGIGLHALSGAINQIITLNSEFSNFRIFCPDEISSNGLDNVLKETGRAYCRYVENTSLNSDERIMEVLSEHLCQGWFQGYTQSGRYGLLVSYEAFLPIIESMILQYMKFLQQSKMLSWRKNVPSLNYIATSLGWQNTYSHQNPNLPNTLVEKGFDFIRVYTPPDPNSLLICFENMIRGFNGINLLVTSKTKMESLFSYEQASELFIQGASILSDYQGSCKKDEEPDAILCGIGDICLRECIACLNLIKKLNIPIKIRLVVVMEMTKLSSCVDDKNYFTKDKFQALFTDSKPVVFSFFGYPSTLKAILFERPNSQRFFIKGYSNRNLATFELDTLILNGVSRYNILLDILRICSSKNQIAILIDTIAELLSNYKTYKNNFQSFEHEFINTINKYILPTV